MRQIKKAALVCCSDGQPVENRGKIEELRQVLARLGVETVMSRYMFADENGRRATGNQRAELLMTLYREPEVDAIFDISGGDYANEILPFLDYETIGASGKLFWGYSDLTAVINAIYTKTGAPSVLYQVRNLVGDAEQIQQEYFSNLLKELSLEGKISGHDRGGAIDPDGNDITCGFVRGDYMSGIVVGGNIRCLLKLAGTPYWPKMKGKILALEARSGNSARVASYFSQLEQMGVFEQVNGVLLGTFSEMERQGRESDVQEILLDHIPETLSVACTKDFGHAKDSKAILIGRQLILQKQ